MEQKELNPKQQTSEAIRASERILIFTGQNPTVDQVASVVALAEILRKLDKKVNAIITDQLPSGARGLAEGKLERDLGGLRDFIMQVNLDHAEVDKIKYTLEDGKLNVHVTPFKGGFAPQDVKFTYGDYQYDLIIIIGVPTYAKIDRLFLQNHELFQSIPLINIDFHRVNENFGAVNLVDTYAASLSEMLVALSESLQAGMMDEPIATALLTGIMAATDRFTANHTTPKALTVAAQMMALGADQQKVVRALYKDRPPQQQAPRKEAVQQATQPSRPQAAQPPVQAPAQHEQAPAQPQPTPVAPPTMPQPTQAMQTPPAAQEPRPAEYEQLPKAQAEVSQAQPEVVNPQPGKTLIAGGRIDRSTMVADATATPVHPEQIALSTDAEPLINADDEVEERRRPFERISQESRAAKAPNPANNPLIHTRTL